MIESPLIKKKLFLQNVIKTINYFQIEIQASWFDHTKGFNHRNFQ